MSICGTGDKSCAICYFGGGGCLATMREDCFFLASERQLVERLNKNEYPKRRHLMIETLKNAYNHEYTGYEELKPLPKQLNCCTRARYSRDSEGEDHMHLEEALLEMITKSRKITKVGSKSVIAYDPDMKKICFWHEEADEKGSHYGCEVVFTDADRISNQWGVISDLPKNFNKKECEERSLWGQQEKELMKGLENWLEKNNYQLGGVVKVTAVKWAKDILNYIKGEPLVAKGGEKNAALAKKVADITEGAKPPLLLNGSLAADSLCTTCKNIFVCPIQSTAIIKSCEMYEKLPNPLEEYVTETRSLNPIKEEKSMESAELVEKEQAEIAKNAWKARLKEEYAQLKERYEELKAYNNKLEVEAYMLKDVAEEPEDMYSRVLLKNQQSVMSEYLHILELRAELAGIQL